MLFTIYVYPMCIIRRLIKLLMPVLWRSMSLLFAFAYSLLNYSDTCRTDDEEHTGHNHHVALCAAYKREDHAPSAAAMICGMHIVPLNRPR